MSPPLTYLPAYVGLFLALVLAIACNAFLDIEYGGFGVEVMLWSLAFAWTLRTAWRQRGEVSEEGQQRQKMVLLLGGFLTVVLFFPMWGLPRAGVYLLAVLQAANNCVTTTRRQLHLGLLVSAVMVMFAASHFRADWTLLFYLLPYLVAVVFTLVSEQVSRRAQDLRQASLGQATSGGQGAAIAAATGTILLLTAGLYLLTPQLTWPTLYWRYGQMSNLGVIGGPLERGASGRSAAADGQGGGAGRQADGHEGDGRQQPGDASSGAGSGDGEAGEGYERLPGSGWPRPAQMREAAGRRGMPRWQSATIMQMASLDEAIQQAMAPLLDALEGLGNALKEWLKEHRSETLAGLLGLLLLAVLIALGYLAREASAVAWLKTRFDYLRLGLLAWHAGGSRAARQYYGAMEALFALGEMPRSAATNTREYLAQTSHLHRGLRREMSEMTLLFEQSRYGDRPLSERQIGRMREVYRQLYRKLSA